MTVIETEQDIRAGLVALSRLDPLIEHLACGLETLPLRRVPAAFSSLAEIVVAQVISRQAADRLMVRLTDRLGPPRAETWSDAAVLLSCGLSGTKAQTIAGLAAAVASQRLDLAALGACSEQEAVAALTALPGIGRWTAEVYLLQATGHRDIFPAGDLALRREVGRALGEPMPSERELRRMAARWAPWRSIAARLFWSRASERPGPDR